MGKLLQFARTRNYKIVLIALVGLGILFLALGGIFAITGTGPVWASGMNISAPNLSQPMAGGIRHLEVFSMTTPITVNTDPFNMTTQPIQLSLGGVGATYATITPTIRSGGVATLTLALNAQGIPHFHNDETDQNNRIILNITVGTLPPEIIFVFVRLPSDQVQIRTQLQWFSGLEWLDIDQMTLTTFRQQGSSRFRVRSTFHIMGVQIFDSASATQIFNFSERDNTGRGIGLFRNPVPPYTIGLFIPNWIITGGTYYFDIAVNFNGQIFNYHNFQLVIV